MLEKKLVTSLLDTIRNSRNNCIVDITRLTVEELLELHKESVELYQRLDYIDRKKKKHLINAVDDKIAKTISNNVLSMIDIIEEHVRASEIVSGRDIYTLHRLCIILYKLCRGCKTSNIYYLRPDNTTQYDILSELSQMFKIDTLIHIISYKKDPNKTIGELNAISEHFSLLLQYPVSKTARIILGLLMCPITRKIIIKTYNKESYTKEEADRVLIDMYIDITLAICAAMEVYNGKEYSLLIDMHFRSINRRLKKYY